MNFTLLKRLQREENWDVLCCKWSFQGLGRRCNRRGGTARLFHVSSSRWRGAFFYSLHGSLGSLNHFFKFSRINSTQWPLSPSQQLKATNRRFRFRPRSEVTVERKHIPSRFTAQTLVLKERGLNAPFFVLFSVWLFKSFKEDLQHAACCVYRSKHVSACLDPFWSSWAIRDDCVSICCACFIQCLRLIVLLPAYSAAECHFWSRSDWK